MAAGLVALAVAVLGAVAHQAVWGQGRRPVGLVLALLLTGAAAVFLRACRVGVVARAVAIGVWVLVVVEAGTYTSEKDLLVPGNVRGYAFLLGGFLVLAVPLIAPERRRSARRG